MEETKFRDANRLSNMVRIMGTAFSYAIQDLEDHLKSQNLQLSGKEKHLYSMLKQSVRRTSFLLADLEDEAFKELEKDPDFNDCSLAYQDAAHMYWYLMLLIVDRSGTDSLSDLRMKAIADKIKEYKSILKIPKLKWAEKIAFCQVEKTINENRYTEDQLKNVLQYEHPDKEDKGKVPG